MEALERMDMSYTGTRKSDRDKRYRVADVGGIPVGLINYTYQAARADGKAVPEPPARGRGRSPGQLLRLPPAGRLL